MAPGTMDTEAVPCVVLASRAADAELDAVASLLGKVGIGCLRLDADTLAGVRILADPGAGTLNAAGRWVKPTITWVRHFSARAIGLSLDGANDIFLRDSWQALIAQLGTVSRAVIRSECPGLLAQLALAEHLGIRVPRTVVASDPLLAKDAIRAQRLVVKGINGHFVEAAPGLLTGVFPEVINRCCLDAPWQQPAAPVIFQEYIEHDFELRTYFIHNEIYGFKVAKNSPADLWLDQGKVTVSEAELPPAARAATSQMAAALKIEYGAFDFLIKDGAPVFLEVNLDGDWHWIEVSTGNPVVTTAAARMLQGFHLRNTNTLRSAEHSPTGSVDLLRFLA